MRVFSVVFIALLLLQSVISLVVYDVKLKQVKRSVKWAYLNERTNEELTLVKVAKIFEQRGNTYFRRVHSKEFQFLGEMYDVVRQQEKGDTTYYYCFHDREETFLAKTIQQQLFNLLAGDTEKSKQQKKVWDFYQIKYVPTSQLLICQTSGFTEVGHPYPFYNLLNGHFQLAVPPPDNV